MKFTVSIYVSNKAITDELRSIVDLLFWIIYKHDRLKSPLKVVAMLKAAGLLERFGHIDVL